MTIQCYHKDAVLSDDGAYRFSLVRKWNLTLPRLLWIMLNPSTADARKDDPTIKKCVGFADRFGHGSIEVVNLYALRATDPKDLWAATGARRCVPENDLWITEAAGRARTIVAAWGAHAREPGRIDKVVKLLCNRELMCLGLTKDKQPRHPLRVAYKTELSPFKAYP